MFDVWLRSFFFHEDNKQRPTIFRLKNAPAFDAVNYLFTIMPKMHLRRELYY